MEESGIGQLAGVGSAVHEVLAVGRLAPAAASAAGMTMVDG